MQMGESVVFTIKANVDKFVFIKNGYSVLKYLVPFTVVCLVLVFLTPSSDLPTNLINNFQDLTPIQTILILLFTFLLIYVYYSQISMEVKKAYLLNEGTLQRTVFTSIIYLIICSAMAYMVLKPASLNKEIGVRIWTSILFALLLHTGVGIVNMPLSWANSIGIKSPDYTDVHMEVKNLAEILSRVRSKKFAEQNDLNEFLDKSKKLSDLIKVNINLEPKWNNKDKDATIITEELDKLVNKANQFNTGFNYRYFSDVCKYKYRNTYSEFIISLVILTYYWREWQYKGE